MRRICYPSCSPNSIRSTSLSTTACTRTSICCLNSGRHMLVRVQAVEHMLFEFRTAWPYLCDGGILLSDDTDWNEAFAEFAAAVQCSPVMFNFRVGAIRKPLTLTLLS